MFSLRFSYFLDLSLHFGKESLRNGLATGITLGYTMVYVRIVYWSKLNSVVLNSILLYCALLLGACLLVCECEGAALSFFGSWLAGLTVKGSEGRLVLLGACLLVCECEGAALRFFYCWLQAACLLVWQWEGLNIDISAVGCWPARLWAWGGGSRLLLLLVTCLVWERDGVSVDFWCWLACLSVSVRGRLWAFPAAGCFFCIQISESSESCQ